MYENLWKIIEHYGINNQQRKLEEEVFELQEAIMELQHYEEYACDFDYQTTLKKTKGTYNRRTSRCNGNIRAI